MRRPGPWDLLGLLCLLSFGGSLAWWVRGSEASAQAEASLLAPGGEIRAGDEWIGLYFQDEKIGVSRVTKTPRGEGAAEGWRYAVKTTLKLAALGVPAQAELDIRADLRADLGLEHFELALRSGAQAFRASGEVFDTVLHLRLNPGGEAITRDIPLGARPVLRDLMGPTLAHAGLTPGRRFRLPGFDPWTLSTESIEIEVIGPDTALVMAQEVPATRVRQRIAGLTLDAWVNERGEMLRQELPLGLVALRQSEEEARWGMAAQGGVNLAETVEVPVPALEPPPAARERLELVVEGADVATAFHRPPRQVVTGTRLVVTGAAAGAGLPLPVPAPHLREPGVRDALKSDALVQSSHRGLRDTARRRIEDATDTVTAARRLMEWLHGAMRFERRGGMPAAVETLEAMAGDCTETTVLFAALARGVGIPTRLVFGLVYKDTPTPRFAWHAWNEVLTADGWLSVDATWGQMPVDVGHLAVATGGFEQQSELLRLMGRVRLRVSPP